MRPGLGCWITILTQRQMIAKQPQSRLLGLVLCGFLLQALLSPETNMTSPLKMDAWNTILSFWDGLLSGANC